ncbi:MAG: AsmA family protein [Candidatus Omnitrophica bacterium]|nr:AsmA family protein [Candidatus Omnitrophota bacterium]
MRIIKIIVLTMLAIVALFFMGIYVFLKTVDINRFKAQITGKISSAINRPVNVRHVSFSFSIVRGITLGISGLSVMDHPDFSSDPMLVIDTARLDLDILSFLLRRQILASGIELDSLRINLIRNSKGVLNFQELGQKGNNKSVDDEVAPLSLAEDIVKDVVNEKSRDFGFDEVLIRSIHVRDGTFSFSDYTTNPSVKIPIKEVDFQISNFSFDVPFPFKLSASLFSDRKNISLGSLALINAQNRQLRIDDLKTQIDLASFSMNDLYEGIPALQEIGLQGRIDGTLVLDVHQMIVSQDGLLVLSSEGRLTDLNVPLKNSPVPIEGLDMRYSLTESDMEVVELTMPVASGEIKVAGKLIEYLSDRKFSADLTITNAQLNELAGRIGLPVKLDGQLFAKYKLNGLGIDRQALQSFLSGEGTVEIKNGRIVDMNLLKLMLSKISFIPDLVSQIESNLPEKYKEKLQVKDTILKKAEMDTKIHEGLLRINRAELNADGFLLAANGDIDFDQNLRLNADFYIPSDLSSSMVAVSKELKYFFDEKQQIHIPLKPFNGKAAQFRTYPDIEDLGKKVISNRGKEELKKVIFKALDLDDDKPQEATSIGAESPTQATEDVKEKPAQESEPSPEEKMIDNIFDMIPIFK